MPRLPRSVFFFFNDTATTEIYTLSLHDALPISPHFLAIHAPAELGPTLFAGVAYALVRAASRLISTPVPRVSQSSVRERSEEHTSELQSPDHLVCRLLLEKKKNKRRHSTNLSA